MKISIRTILALALLFAVVAFAAPAATRNLNLWVQSHLWVGTYPSTTSNAVTQLVAPSVQRIDFGTVDAGTVLASDAIAVPGASMGDPCIVNHPLLAADGGTGSDLVQYSCIVSAAGYVKINAISWAPTGTGIDPPDQLFNLRIISNQ